MSPLCSIRPKLADRYGASLRKQVKKQEITQHARCRSIVLVASRAPLVEESSLCLLLQRIPQENPNFRVQLTRLVQPTDPCSFCGKTTVKRVSTGIWKCKACRKTLAGGAYVVS
ncbi:hypothetical protein EV356DRAFT_504881 [Viridothelium virens]|uniref:Ribosomal protein L37ae n=1 Tax=Viridothelium virens TaxID=1048519 RepID=A0A6A6H492_VIRVR|nr:hypothetical protein EV356DRAFT_504881 [Viridothelium virens]